jgi:hypothetical protein
LKKVNSMKSEKNIVFLELPFFGFSIDLIWLPYDKAASEVAKSIVKESFLYKRKIEKFIAESGVKQSEASVFACGKEYALSHGFTKDFEVVTANTQVFKQPYRGTLTQAIHVALTDDFENYKNRDKLRRIIFLCFFHELLHSICNIENEKLVDKITEEFKKEVSIKQNVPGQGNGSG